MNTKTDIVWEYFDLLREHGEEASFTIKRFSDEKLIDSVRFDHRQYDGISAMCELARTLPSEGFAPPQLIVSPPPPLFQKLKLLMLWSLQLWPGIGKEWKKAAKQDSPVSSFIQLTPEEWLPLKRAGGTAKVLAALDEVAQLHLTSSWLPRLWMIPVGLYPQIDREITPQNRVSFVDVRLFKHGNAIKDIAHQLRRDLRRGLYWGSFLSMYAIKIMGKKIFLAQLKFMHHFFRRTGTLTNVGDWTLPALPPEEWWAVQVTVAKISPVGASMLEINGRLGLSIQFHQDIGWQQDQAQNFIEKWKESLLSQSK